MNHFRKILLFAKPYVRYAWLNTLFNILYAVFNILTVLSFLPVLSILFKTDTKVYEKPIYSGLSNSFDYLKNSFYFTSTHIAFGIVATRQTILFVKSFLPISDMHRWDAGTPQGVVPEANVAEPSKRLASVAFKAKVTRRAFSTLRVIGIEKKNHQ